MMRVADWSPPHRQALDGHDKITHHFGVTSYMICAWITEIRAPAYRGGRLLRAHTRLDSWVRSGGASTRAAPDTDAMDEAL